MTTQTFAVDRQLKLVVRIGHGSLRVTAVDGLSEATVTLSVRSGPSTVIEQTTVELRGSTLQIATPRTGGIFDLIGGRTQDAVDIEVTVPSGTPIRIGSFTADISLLGRCGGVDLGAGVTEFTAEQIDGDLRLRYGSGNSSIQRVTGSATVKSGSGVAHFGEVGGSLTSACGSGRLVVDTARGPVRFRTGSGEAELGAIFGNVDLASGSGALSIGVPAGVVARLDLTSGSGHIDPQLPVSAKPDRERGSITIRAKTGSGDVRLFRAA